MSRKEGSGGKKSKENGFSQGGGQEAPNQARDEQKEKGEKRKIAESVTDEVTEHAREPKEILHDLSVDPEQGLRAEEVTKRQEEHGMNVIPEKGRASVLMLILKQFKDLLIIILFVAAGIAWYVGEMTDVYIILSVILFNAVMGFTQEYRAEKAIESIKSMVQHKGLVIRNGKKETVEAKEIVPGDIIVLEEGQTIPADSRILEAKNLQLDEASLTGESQPASKDPQILEKNTPLGDRTNMVWKSTHVLKGSGLAVVIATGRETQIGQIAHSLGTMKKTRSNFRKKTNRLARIMAAVSIGSAAIVFCIGFFYRNFEFEEILLITIATIVSSIPEGLPVVISILLAIGAHRMAKKNAIIREFTATEELGSVSTILSDKTGTITEGVLTVRKIIGANGQELEVSGLGYDISGQILSEGNEISLNEDMKTLTKILIIAAYCNQASLRGTEKQKEDNARDKGNDGSDSETDRVEQSMQRIKDDIERLAEDMREKLDQGKEYERAKKKNKEYLEKDIERLEEDVAGSAADDNRVTGGQKEAGGEINTQNEEKDGAVTGDPTEVALLVMAEKSGIKRMDPFDKIRIIDDLPFSTDNNYRATLIEYPGKDREILVVGAPETVVEMSANLYKEGKSDRIKNEDIGFIDKVHNDWADQALRIIALAHKAAPRNQEKISEDDVTDLVWTGSVGIIDPARKEAAEAIKACKSAGIRVLMVTGDHKKTAAAIARDVGIIDEKGDDKDHPLAASEKDLKGGMDEKEFDDLVDNVSVFARVSPQTKLRIAESLQNKGELVAMTGDGVNDALALQKADVGIAMGVRGTDVAKDASQIVLSDDNFASIVNAIREGRIIFTNLKNTTYFLITTNIAAVITFIVALLAGMPIPLTAVQILWVNLVTDGAMDIALATEPGHKGIMNQKPIRRNAPILSWEFMPNLAIISVIMVSFTLLTFNYYLPQGTEMARTGAFLMISMTQVFNVFNLRDRLSSAFSIGFFSNKWINIAFVVSIALQLAVIKLPFFRKLFGFEDLPYIDALVIIAISSSVLWAGELYKLIRNKIRTGKVNPAAYNNS